MTLRFASPFVQALSDTGAPLPGAKLYFYAAGTSTPQDTYADAARTVANANPVVADAGGRFPDIFLGSTAYRVVLQTAAGVTVWTADPVPGDTSAASAASVSSASLLINGAGAVFQRPSGSFADGNYTADGWYVLTQSAAISVAQQSDQEAGQPTNIRLTQTSATAQRIGFAQAIESANCRHLRDAAATFAGRIRCSVSQPIRYAVLEWTGAADSITRDVVSDWTSASYTAGGFFLAADVVVAKVGSVTPAANTWTDLPALTGAFSGSLNNLIVLVWTEGTLAQNATLDFGLKRLTPGSGDAGYQPRAYAEELRLCRHYLRKLLTPYASAVGPVSPGAIVVPVLLDPPMRGTPTLTNIVAPSLVGATSYNFGFANNYGFGIGLTMTGAAGAVWQMSNDGVILASAEL